MKKLILLSSLILCSIFIAVQPAKAYDFYGNLFFDNTNTNWTNTDIKMCIGNQGWNTLWEPTNYYSDQNIKQFSYTGYTDDSGTWQSGNFGCLGFYIINTTLTSAGSSYYYMNHKVTHQNTTKKIEDSYNDLYLVITPTGPDYSSTSKVTGSTTDPTISDYYPGIDFELRPLPLYTLTLADATNATNIYGGTGTSDDPFIVRKDEEISCSAGCTFFDVSDKYTQEAQYSFSNTGETTSNLGTTVSGTNTATYTFKPSETGEFQISYTALNHTSIDYSEFNGYTVYPDSRTDACSTKIYYKVIDQLEIDATDDQSTTPAVGTYADISVTLKYTNNDIFQFVSMPFDVNKIEIKDKNASDFTEVTLGKGTSNARILTYNTATRASGTRDGSEWDDVNTTTLEKGKGYMIGFGNDFVAPLEVRYSMSSYATVSHDQQTNNLTEYTSSSVADDSNWNLIGLNQWGTGSIDGPTVIGIPKTDSKGYLYYINEVDVQAQTLDPYSAFFVQYSGDVTSTLTTTQAGVRAQSPQARTQNGQEYYIFNISGTSVDNTARAAVCLDPNGSEDYVAGSDFPNLNGAGTCALFTTLNAKDYFLNNVPDTTTTLSLNATLTADETYIISMDDRSNSAVNVWLVDHVLNTTTDLKVNDYSFTGTTGAVQGRFTVQIAKTQQIPTGNNNQSASELEVYAAQGSITIQGLNPESKVYIYNAVGQLIAQPQADHTYHASLSISNVPTGFYLVKISDFNGNHTYKLQL